ncbi:hypothetical protein BVC80_7441g4 [Macleaya cordata]|uniref:Uncharacterized protein n=1 Tax=Macleaya cordata TaxID=56857 RepID=A0A200R9J1_MACCD|nr:hypothetical protein BVC80_7441g4 [Macleaya cordata]
MIPQLHCFPWSSPELMDIQRREHPLELNEAAEQLVSQSENQDAHDIMLYGKIHRPIVQTRQSREEFFVVPRKVFVVHIQGDLR